MKKSFSLYDATDQTWPRWLLKILNILAGGGCLKSYYADKVKRISEVEDMQRSFTKDLQRIVFLFLEV